MGYSTNTPVYIIYSEEIEFIRFDIEQNCLLFESTIVKIYSDLKNDCHKVKTEYESSIKNANSEDRIRLYQYFSDELEEKSILIPQFILRSLYLSIYGYYENILYNDYLKKVFKIKRPDNWDEFLAILADKQIECYNPETFDFYRRIRNKLIHRNGLIKNGDLKDKIEKDYKLELKNDRLIIKDIHFFKDFLSYINKFTENILLTTEYKYFVNQIG